MTWRRPILPLAVWAYLFVAACGFPDVRINPEATCTTDEDCPVGRCNEDALCDQCDTDSDCEGSLTCDGRRCVACRDDEDCPGSLHCDGVGCVACLSDADCNGGRCDPEGHCVDCLDDGDCGGGHCSTEQSCAECLEPGHCAPTQDCVEQQCFDVHCSSGAKDADETGKDCGGSCPACPVGEGCAAPSDCASGVCDEDTKVCMGCTTTMDCPVDTFCLVEVGSCEPRRMKGEACPTSDACVSGSFCVQEVCCESACGDACHSCLGADTGVADGECDVAPGKKCKLGLNLPGLCDAQGECHLSL